MKNQLSDSESVKILVDACAVYGIYNIVLSSGSRNAPLIVSFNRREEFNTYTITDERSAAFFALGMAEQLDQPVAIVCTSGTALLNYAPAVAEAYYKGIPIVVISADRPIEQIDQGDGQAIRQIDSLKNFVKESISLPIVASSEDSWYINNILTKAFYALINKKSGPIHINVPLREPLYNTREYSYTSKFPNILNIDRNICDVDKLLIEDKINKYKRILIIPCIAEDNKRLHTLIEKISKYPQIVVLTETINNLNSKDNFHGIDKYIKAIQNEDIHDEYHPELLITFGDILISRMVKTFLSEIKSLEHWHINESEKHIDMFHKLSFRIDIKASVFLESINIKENRASNYRNLWIDLSKRINDYSNLFTREQPWSDYKLFTNLSNLIPKDYIIHSGNSTVIRYLQIVEKFKEYKCFCNRGTSGIDGSVSTAVGASVVNNKKNLLIVGDLSFYYDSNGLWNKYLSKNLKIILINNQGGNIFRFINGPSNLPELESFFEHKIDISACGLSKTFDIDYFSANSDIDLINIFDDFINSDRCSILEVRTPRKINDLILKKYFTNINTFR